MPGVLAETTANHLGRSIRNLRQQVITLVEIVYVYVIILCNLKSSVLRITELSKLNVRTEYTVRTSFMEIHNEEVHDLFRDNMALRMYDYPLVKGSVSLKQLRTVTVFNTANHLCSHVILRFLVSVREIDGRGDEINRSVILRLLDLLGSESAGRERARDFGNVNRSIQTAPIVIKAIAQRIQHVPRESNLTRILQDNLNGNTKTAMIAKLRLLEGHSSHTGTRTARFIYYINFLKELDDEFDKLNFEFAAAKRCEGVFVSNQSFKQMTDDTNNNNQKVLKLVAELANHKCSIDLQYRFLQLSFHKTKDVLETVQQRIAETRKVLLNEKVTLNAATEKHKDFTKTLLDVCRRSTRNKEIYYRKYQQATAANKQNAQKSKAMLSILNSCLQDVVDETQHLAVLSKETSDSACCMDFIASDMRSYADNYNLTLNEVARNDLNCHLKALQDVPSGRFEHNLAHVRTPTKIRDTMEAIKQDYETDLRDMGVHSENTSHSVSRKTADENEALIKTANKNFFQNSKALLERAAILEAHIAKVKAIKERNANMALAPVRESINHYLEQPPIILNTSMVKIKNVLQQAESRQSLVHTQAESDRSSIHRAVKEMEATVKENLTQRNEEVRNRQNLVEKTLPTLGRMDDTFMQLSQNLVHRNKKSTVTNLAVFAQYVSEITDCNGQYDVVYTDFAKAFDQIDHGLLLEKLSNLGFSN
ncbi:kinesin-like protein Klp61F [Zophobas morio]|uniref:kinesin-like protein Klp61F n=1 Tax=Zophobas morio TaxID=2755281 RepID=UPI0030835698